MMMTDVPPDVDPVEAIGTLLDRMRVLLEQIQCEADRMRQKSTRIHDEHR